MRAQLVRHATLILDSSLGRILVDPMLRPAGSSPPIESMPLDVPILTHEAINHCLEPRSAYAGAIVPSDGEVLEL